jgi:putative flippase GtrA
VAARLETFPALAGLVRFGIVGASGVLVNLAVLVATLTFSGARQSAGWHACAETMATQVAILWNFGLTETWVFPAGTSPPQAPRWLRFCGYWLTSMLGLAVQLPLTAALVRILPIAYVIGTGLALLLLVVARYLVCRGVVYRPPGLGSVSVERWLTPSLYEEGPR